MPSKGDPALSPRNTTACILRSIRLTIAIAGRVIVANHDGCGLSDLNNEEFQDRKRPHLFRPCVPGALLPR